MLRPATLGDDALARRACVLAAADPEAMRRVLEDAELRAALREALGVDEREGEGSVRAVQ